MQKRIFLLGEIVPGQTEIQWRIAPLPVKEQAPVDGELQRLIWEAEETEDYENDMLDREFWSRGQW